jgi:sterol desaturase/sphingolipid hydroxylase (fatty acid hydroxylase superfamily)
MQDNHLSDEAIQAFVLKEIQNEAIDIHIATCEICRTKIETYQHLMAGLNKTIPETFSFDVSTLVMHKIELYAKKEKIKTDLTFWGIMAGLTAGIVLLSFPYLQPLLGVFYAKTFFTNLLLIGTAVCIMLFFIIDSYRQYKHNEKKLFSNHLQPIS